MTDITQVLSWRYLNGVMTLSLVQPDAGHDLRNMIREPAHYEALDQPATHADISAMQLLVSA